jgi:hypothetical protein
MDAVDELVMSPEDITNLTAGALVQQRRGCLMPKADAISQWV